MRSQRVIKNFFMNETTRSGGSPPLLPPTPLSLRLHAPSLSLSLSISLTVSLPPSVCLPQFCHSGALRLSLYSPLDPSPSFSVCTRLSAVSLLLFTGYVERASSSSSVSASKTGHVASLLRCSCSAGTSANPQSARETILLPCHEEYPSVRLTRPSGVPGYGEIAIARNKDDDRSRICTYTEPHARVTLRVRLSHGTTDDNTRRGRSRLQIGSRRRVTRPVPASTTSLISSATTVVSLPLVRDARLLNGEQSPVRTIERRGRRIVASVADLLFA